MTFFQRQERLLPSHRRIHLIIIVPLVYLFLQCNAFCPWKRTFPIHGALRLPLAATSSKRLKDEQQRRPPRKKKKENAVKRLARAAANAAALYPPEDTLTATSSSRSSLGTLRQLTHAIDEQLLQKRQASFSPSLQPQDSMSMLLGFNEEHVSTDVSYKVAIVFAKTLQDDQVTVEYAARIRSLVELLKDKNSHVDIVCFCGHCSEENNVATADAGYVYFRHLCAAQKVDLSLVDMFVDRTSKDEGTALQNVVKHLQSYYIPDWFQECNLQECEPDEPRKRLSIHLSLISSGYHLCNLNDIHHRSPGQSPLRPIELMRKEYSSIVNEEQWDDDSVSEVCKGVVESSWSYRSATYPYLYAKDDAVAFMARCFLLGEELIPLLINLRGVVREKEFFQRDNYLVLASIRRSLVSQMEELYKTKPTLRSDLRTPGRDVNVALEGVVLSLGRCIDLVRPAGLLVGSVSKMDFQKALRALEHAVSHIRAYCDPDEPLEPSEWGKLEKRFAGGTNLTSHERLYTQLDSLAWEAYEHASTDGKGDVEDTVIVDED